MMKREAQVKKLEEKLKPDELPPEERIVIAYYGEPEPELKPGQTVIWYDKDFDGI